MDLSGEEGCIRLNRPEGEEGDEVVELVEAGAV